MYTSCRLLVHFLYPFFTFFVHILHPFCILLYRLCTLFVHTLYTVLHFVFLFNSFFLTLFVSRFLHNEKNLVRDFFLSHFLLHFVHFSLHSWYTLKTPFVHIFRLFVRFRFSSCLLLVQLVYTFSELHSVGNLVPKNSKIEKKKTRARMYKFKKKGNIL